MCEPMRLTRLLGAWKLSLPVRSFLLATRHAPSTAAWFYVILLPINFIVLCCMVSFFVSISTPLFSIDKQTRAYATQ